MKRKPDGTIGLKALLILLIVVLMIGTGVMIRLSLNLADRQIQFIPEMTGFAAMEQTEPSDRDIPTETTQPQPDHVVSTATIGAMGDLLMHMTIFDDLTKYNAEVQQSDGSYDFESVFRYLTDYTSAMDFAVANLETTLCSPDNGYAYSGYPLFNCPDELVDGVKNAGFDLLLTANNHSYDTSLVGMKRTLEVIRDRELESLGTYASSDAPKWTIQNINGIRVGMLCYTYATSVTEDGRPSLNLNAAISEPGLCNYYTYGNLEAFYTEVSGYLQDMKNEGAEATVIFMHWGQEYILTENAEQNAIAQKLCDLGVDVIIGGHPHVIQPMELLTSTVAPEKKTVCIYSLGNAVSNQRKGNLQAISTAHTEDGVLFSVSFEKYSDGTVYLAGVNVLPTWVNMHNNQRGKTEYNILPLDMEVKEQWQSLFNLDASTVKKAEESWNRTMEILGAGIEEVKTYLSQEKEDREAYYLELVTGK